MKSNLLISALFIISLYATAQDPAGERVLQQLADHPQQDTFRVNRLIDMVFYSRDEAYYLEALTISRKIGYELGEAYALTHLGFSKSRRGNRQEGDSIFQRVDSIAKKTGNIDLLATLQIYQGYSTLLTATSAGLSRLLTAEKTAEKSGNKRLLSICQFYIAIEYANGNSNLPKGMEYYLKSIQTGEEVNYLRIICASFIAVGRLYDRMDDQANASIYFEKAREANKQLKSPTIESQLLLKEGNNYEKAGKYSKAIDAFKRALQSAKGADSVLIVTIQMNLADAYTSIDSLAVAFRYGLSAARFAKKVGDYLLLSNVTASLSKTYLKNKMPDSAIYYARLGYDSSKSIGAIEVLSTNTEALANAYAYKKDFANAYAYHLQYINYRDSALNTDVRNKSAVAQYNHDLEKKQAQITALNQQKKAQQYFLYSVLAVLLLIVITSFLLLRSNRQKHKANKLLQKQKHEIEDQRDQINQALGHLQQTQKQLIQSEKMASLGELTAGIAHEIQNPLNFVNNFSEVNKEMLAELAEQIDNGSYVDAKAIAKDLIANEEKINHHGKRADAIVKSMLQHSRSSSGQKVLTDINALADEYLRLSYHGIRGKDKSFNVVLHTDFDAAIGKINIIPQDIGRVLLNLYNNAFYAARPPDPHSGEKHEPTITVKTKKIGDKILISVGDNGTGVPQNIVDKIFQPFFTTKPTGEGTGLGLSLSYDIIKSHGGEIKVETKMSEGATFIILLPLQSVSGEPML